MSHSVNERTVEYWDCDPDAERLSNTSISDAVLYHFDARVGEPIPESAAVYGFARIRPTLQDLERTRRSIIEQLYEALDEEYGDPDGRRDCAASEAVESAATALCEAVLEGYESWACERVRVVTVDPRDHVPAEWLEEGVNDD